LNRTKDFSKNVAVLPRRKRGRLGLYKLTIISSLVFVLLLLAVIGFQYAQKHQLQQQLIQNQARINEYEALNLSHGREIEKLKQTSYIEILARKYLGLVKPGETVFLLED